MTEPYRAPAWLESAAVFLAMVLTALGMSAAFSDVDWFAPVLLAVLVIVAIGAIFRSVGVLRASGTAVIVQCVAGIYTALVLCVPGSMVGGVIPTGGSFGRLLDLLSEGVSDLYATTPPAPSTPGFTAMLVIAFTLIAILIDGLVSDLKAPKVSGILLLVLWMIPVFFAPAQVRWWHVAAVLAAFILLMLIPYFPAAKWRGGLTAVLAGTVAVAIGIGVPTVLPEVPTLTNRASANQDDLTVTNPFLDLRADLGQRDDATLFRYTTTEKEPQPLRLTSVDDFDGQTWAPSPFPLDPFAVAEDGLPWPAGLPRDGGYSEERIDVTVDGLDQQYLPTPYAPQTPTGLDRRWIFDEKTLTVVGNGESTARKQYAMDYLSVTPTAADLQKATPVSAGEFETELQVPAALPDKVRETAEKVTAGADNQWEAAALLQAYFRSGEFEYSLDAPEQASGNAIADFLKDKKGYCVQFASAMTIMARTMGIPARIAVGFAAGTADGDAYRVSMQDSHAWPELYFEGAGWVRFEPTPGGPTGAPPEWTLASGGSDDDSESTEESAEPTSEPTDEVEDTTAPDTEEPSTTAAAEPTGESMSTSLKTILWAIGIALAIMLLLCIPALLRVVKRRSRLADPVDPEKVWTEIRSLAIDYDQELDPSATLRLDEITLAEAAGEGTSSVPSPAAGSSVGDGSSGASAGTGAADTAGGSAAAALLLAPLPKDAPDRPDTALGGLIDALEARRYGQQTAEFSRDEALAAVDEVRSTLIRRASPAARFRAHMWPSSLVGAVR